MRKIFTLLGAALVWVALGCQSAFAVDYYKNYFINANFNEIDAWPSGWVVRTGNGDSPFGKNGSMAIGNQMITFGGSGSGSRGASLFLPSTSTASFAYPADSVWCIEFDWTLQGRLTNRNVMAILVSGSGAISANSADNWYTPGIFGLYAYRNGGFLHYMNLQRDGWAVMDAAGQPTGELTGQVISGGNGQAFTRANTDNVLCDSLNFPTRTKVIVTSGNTYHISAKIDLKVGSQRVLELSIVDNADLANGDTITTPLEFLAPTYAATVPPAAFPTPAERKVTDIGIISMQNTRGSNAGNGDNADIGGGLDNLEIYVWKESLGKRDVTINYKDQNGGVVKTARVVSNLEVGNPYALINSDKQNVLSGGFYYAYDAEATKVANQAKSEDGQSLVVALDAAYNSLDVMFKKTAMTAGTYVWSGNNSYKWNYLDENFSVNGGSLIAYQAGNPVAFSKTDATNKEIEVADLLEMGDANITVSAPDYTLGGSGRITGIGAMMVNAPVTLNADNRLEGGVIIGTPDAVLFRSNAAATKITAAAPVITLNLEVGGAFNKAIAGPEGGAGILNVKSILQNSAISSPITGFSTVNISLAHRGQETSNSWTNPFTTTFSGGATVNIIDAIEQATAIYPATYAIDANSLADAKVHLGDNTRIILNATPGANSTTTVNIGELTGTANSSIQGNCVGAAYDRVLAYSIGGLNTDAVFNGNIIPQLTREPARRSGTKLVWEPLTVEGDTVWYLPSALKLYKVGTGTWTVGGKIIIPDADSPSTITVSGGTLELLDAIEAPPVNLITLTVDAAGTLKTHGNSIGAYTTTVNGILAGGATFGGTVNVMDQEHSVLKLKVNSFAAGDFEKIKTAGDIIIKAGTLDITVTTPPSQNQEIVILESEGNYDIIDNMANVKVLVNGVDITANTAQMNPGATGLYYFNPEQGILGFLSSGTGLHNVFASKEIKDVEYYNLLGQKVMEDNIGVTLKKIIYTDNSTQTIKIINKKK